MSLQSPGTNNANDANQVDGLKIWSCTNCRRRKVRCDRRYPCAPCTRNKAECTFPVTGRIPRRGSRDASNPKSLVPKQTELVGRLRRLEAMIGGLSSQVEHATVANQDDAPMQGSTNDLSVASVTPSEMSSQDHRLSYSKSATESSNSTRDGDQITIGVAERNSKARQVSDDSEEMMTTNNGEIVVGSRFWSVFCKEVHFSSTLVDCVMTAEATPAIRSRTSKNIVS